MIYTLVFGASVRNDARDFGKLQRIIVNNGIANQLSVEPGLFSYERIVPINVIHETSEAVIRIGIDDNDWASYSAFKIDQSLTDATDDTPNLAVLTPTVAANSTAVDTGHPTEKTGARGTATTVDEMSVVLTARTVVLNEAAGTEHKLRGLIVDTGRLQQLLVENGEAIPFDAVSRLDEARIHVGDTHQQPLLDADRGYESTTARDPAGDQRR